MLTYCFSCRKHTDDISSNKVVRQTSKCANCLAKKTRFLKQKPHKKSISNKINLKLVIY